MTTSKQMRTKSVPIAITCPEWCSRTAEEHAADLWNFEGRCIHLSENLDVADPVGWSSYGEPTRYHSMVNLYITSSAWPDGRECESATVFLDGHEMSMEQALLLSDELRRQVEAYRAAGGTS